MLGEKLAPNLEALDKTIKSINREFSELESIASQIEDKEQSQHFTALIRQAKHDTLGFTNYAQPKMQSLTQLEVTPQLLAATWADYSKIGTPLAVTARNSFAKLSDAGDAYLAQSHTNTKAELDTLRKLVPMLLLVATIVASALAAWVAISILRGVQKGVAIAQRVASGDLQSEIEQRGAAEISQLMGALADMQQKLQQALDERMAVQQAISDENEQLNDAVLGLLQAVAVLARKDLTHKVPVTEDVTGPVADALNMLASETSKVLQRVSDLSADVTQASLNVKAQSDEVIEVAAREREEVGHAAKALTVAADSMTKIAAVARTANQSAEHAIRTTRQALDTVNSTVTGISNTREMIRETEKRIKRLGERSQEISLAVNLINSISERTHILALNASMHAASAGEAGRGFAVVADEVQRLAENARQATQQITSLVHNIQADTAETVGAMNQAIELVVSGSRLAEQAGQQMEVTEQNTSQLVKAVQQIAVASEAQVRVNRDLVVRAEAITASSQYTNEKLREQSAQTDNLVEYARGLLAAVRVFKLPD